MARILHYYFKPQKLIVMRSKAFIKKEIIVGCMCAKLIAHKTSYEYLIYRNIEREKTIGSISVNVVWLFTNEKINCVFFTNSCFDELRKLIKLGQKELSKLTISN